MSPYQGKINKGNVKKKRKEQINRRGKSKVEPGGLVERCERVHVSNLGPGHGPHLRGGVELHGARAQRNHGITKRHVFVLESFFIITLTPQERERE